MLSLGIRDVAVRKSYAQVVTIMGSLLNKDPGRRLTLGELATLSSNDLLWSDSSTGDIGDVDATILPSEVQDVLVILVEKMTSDAGSPWWEGIDRWWEEDSDDCE